MTPSAILPKMPPAFHPSQPGWPLSSLLDARAALDTFVADASNIARIEACADLIAERFRAGNTLLAIGNGGSICDAMHLAEEFTGRFRADRPPLPAIACSDPSHLTCVANDYAFDQVFSRWVRALGRPGDVLVALSTSGNSPNIIAAIDTARQIGLHVVLLLGKNGGRLAPRPGANSSFSWIVPGETSDRIQELHMLILHTLIEGVEQRLFPGAR